jgi:hypothetical protein
MKKLDALEKIFMAPDEERGIRDDSGYLLSELYSVAEIIEPTVQSPGDNAMRALERLKQSVDTAVAAVNTFDTSSWVTWKEQAAKVKVEWE